MVELAGQAAWATSGWLGALARSCASPSAGAFWRRLDRQLDPGEAWPRQSPDAEVYAFSSARRGASYVLKNGFAGTYLRLTPAEYFVWERLDGRTVRQLLADQL